MYKMKKDKNIYITKPYLPPLSEFIPYLENIWDNRILTNNGPYHKQFEDLLCEYLDVPYVSLFNNGTIALISAIKILDVSGEIITTPYTFVATSNAIVWAGCDPVFVDIENNYFNLDPKNIKSAITDKTSAILPVHCYGYPCEVDKLVDIAKNYGLKLIYDAAHSFAVKTGDKSILSYGDLSILSFHATKVFHTFEGGAIICHDAQTKEKIERIKNFGFTSESQVSDLGINGKMSEFQAAIGILQLQYFEENLKKREKVDRYYREELKNISEITIPKKFEHITQNYSYFPILVNANKRDLIYNLLKEKGIYVRRYFYPSIPETIAYQNYTKTTCHNIENSLETSSKILCLPIYPGLSENDLDLITSNLRKIINK